MLDRRFRARWTVLCLALVVGASAAAAAGSGAEDLTLYDLHAKPFDLARYRGKPVVLDFWAPWCAPCRKSFPFLDDLQRRYADRGLQVVGLTLESDTDAVLTFLDAVPVRFPIAIDSTERAGDVFEIAAMPTTLLLDREGRVVARFEGGDTRVHERIEAAVRTLLDGGTLPPGTDVLVSSSLAAKGPIRAWERGYLADPIMSLDGDVLRRVLRDHIFASKEGAAGDGGAAGGGCGCN